MIVEVLVPKLYSLCSISSYITDFYFNVGSQCVCDSVHYLYCGDNSAFIPLRSVVHFNKCN